MPRIAARSTAHPIGFFVVNKGFRLWVEADFATQLPADCRNVAGNMTKTGIVRIRCWLLAGFDAVKKFANMLDGIRTAE